MGKSKKRRGQAISLIFISPKGHRPLSIKTYWIVLYLVALFFATSTGISLFFLANFGSYRVRVSELSQARQQNRERNEMIGTFKREAEKLHQEIAQLIQDGDELKTKANMILPPEVKSTPQEAKKASSQPAPPHLPSIKPVNGRAIYRFADSRTLSSGLSISQKGMTFSAGKDKPVVATGDGLVEMVGQGKLYGNQVLINHGRGYKSFYGHLSKAVVAGGNRVKKGTVIGHVGETGRLAKGSTLFYQVFFNRQPVDPEKYF